MRDVSPLSRGGTYTLDLKGPEVTHQVLCQVDVEPPAALAESLDFKMLRISSEEVENPDCMQAQNNFK